MSINAYKVLGPLKSGQTVARISPPSDYEILQAYAEKTEESRKLERASVTREYIGETADPKRFIPTLGDAVQHHSLYECMLFDEGGLIDTIIVDHYHFHIGSEDPPKTQTPAGFRRFLNVQQIEQSRSSKDTCGT